MHNGVVSDFITIRRAMSAKMSDAAFANVFGSTDSEHLAALYMTYLTNSADESSFQKEFSVREMAAAMHNAVATVINLQRTMIGDKKRQPDSLNLCATDGVKLVAYRFRNHATSQPPSLYYSTKAGVTLNRKYPDHPDGLIAKNEELKANEDQHGKHLVSWRILQFATLLVSSSTIMIVPFHCAHIHFSQIVASEPSTYKIEDWQLIGKNQYVTADADGSFEIHDIPYEKAWDAEVSL